MVLLVPALLEQIGSVAPDAFWTGDDLTAIRRRVAPEPEPLATAA